MELFLDLVFQLKGAMTSLINSLKKGYKVKAYLHWTFLDNFEWDLGNSTNFGLCYLDQNSKIIPRQSAKIYSKYISNFTSGL